MCTMLGKTLAWDDGDITVEYPSLADDWRITPNGITMPTVEEEEESPSLMHAPLAHAKYATNTCSSETHTVITNIHHELDSQRLSA